MEAPTPVWEDLSLREDEPQNIDVTNNRYLREADLAELNRHQAFRFAVLTEQNNRQSTFRGQVAYILSLSASFVCILAILIYGLYQHWNMVSELNILREQHAALNEYINRQAERIDQLETDSKSQREFFDTQLRENDYKIKLGAKNSENHLLRDQIAFANQQNEFLQSQMKKTNDDCKEKYDQALTFPLQENETYILFRGQVALGHQQNESLQYQMKKTNDEFKEKDDQALAVRLQENQFHQEGVNFFVISLQEKYSAPQRFTGISLFWGLVQVGYKTKSGLY